MNGMPLARQVLTLVQYLHHLVYHRGATTGVIEACLLAVKHYLHGQGHAREVFDDPYVQRMSRTARRAAAKVNPTPKRPILLPASVEMVEESRRSAGVSDSVLEQMCDLAFRVGWLLGNRSSELTLSTLTAHQLKASQVLFYGADLSSFSAPEAHEKGMSNCNVTCVRLYWPTSKTGSKTLYISSATPLERDIIADLLQWSAVHVRDDATTFFSYRHGAYQKCLTRKLLAEHIKTLARHFQLDARHFSTHSMRIGAATDLATRGASKSQIDASISWSTKASTSLRYTRSTPRLGMEGVLCLTDLRVMQSRLSTGPVTRSSLARTALGEVDPL
jgi:hypothetical protein